MINRITLLLFIGLTWGQVRYPETSEEVNNQEIVEENDSFRKHNLSIGMLGTLCSK